jgi:hypothetical protein
MNAMEREVLITTKIATIASTKIQGTAATATTDIKKKTQRKQQEIVLVSVKHKRAETCQYILYDLYVLLV